MKKIIIAFVVITLIIGIIMPAVYANSYDIVLDCYKTTTPKCPTEKPTATPTIKPTECPTEKPTAKPTIKPTATAKPTVCPTETKTAKPTCTPGKPIDHKCKSVILFVLLIIVFFVLGFVLGISYCYKKGFCKNPKYNYHK